MTSGPPPIPAAVLARIGVSARTAERALDLAAGRTAPAQPVPAATVLLVRDTPGGLEVYTLLRNKSMAFAGGMHAFPGGRVDPADSEEHPSRGRERMDPFRVAAIRELYEETSVLLAATTPDAGAHPVGMAGAPGWDGNGAEAAETDGGEPAPESFGRMLRDRELYLRPDLLFPCGHWITPEPEPRRYDTWFYLARLPAGQVARNASGEAERAGWWPPAELLAGLVAGEVAMLPPTAAMLGGLAEFETVDKAIAGVRGWSLDVVCPTVSFDADWRARWSMDADR